MIIDCILDRHDAEQAGLFRYNPLEFYWDMLGYSPVSDTITRAMDCGTDADVRSALCAYIDANGYAVGIKDFVSARRWLSPDRNEAAHD